LKSSGSWQKTLFWVTLFSIAMGFLECAVVVYLRAIYFPNGFGFPLAPMNNHIAAIELMREASTIIMLLGIGFIGGEDFTSRFAYFIYSFAIWDIFYYLFLKIFLNWPESLATWDVLFLIPITWTSPVIAPIVVSCSMIVLSLLILIRKGNYKKVEIDRFSWTILITGSILVILSFILDFTAFVLEKFSFAQLWSLPDKRAISQTAYSYIPRNFNWFLFILGELIIVSGIGRIAAKSGVFKKRFQ
jgi:hypothetical protein